MKNEDEKLSKLLKKNRPLYKEIYNRAFSLGIVNDNKIRFEMDISSADNYFDLRLNDLLNSDDYYFSRDIIGIQSTIVRDKYPSSNFKNFVPKFSNYRIVLQNEEKQDILDNINYYLESAWQAPSLDESTYFLERLPVLPMSDYDEVVHEYIQKLKDDIRQKNREYFESHVEDLVDSYYSNSDYYFDNEELEEDGQLEK